MKPVTTPESRFWPRVEKTDSCWIWKGPTTSFGYGYLSLGGRGGKKVYAHRFSYELVKRIPAELELDHLCRTPGCVNPDHLEPVTHLENVQRGASGKAQLERTHCPRGHEYTSANTYTQRPRKTGRVRRSCRRCAIDRAAAFNARKR